MKISNSPSAKTWGQTATLDGKRLIFSGLFDASRIRAEKWDQIFPFFSQPPTASQKNAVDVYSLFSPNAKWVWREAFYLAKKHGREVSLEDIFLALLKDQEIQKLFWRIQQSAKTAENFLKNYLKLSPPNAATQDIKKLPFVALNSCIKFHAHEISPLLLFLGLTEILPANNIINSIFSNVNLNKEKLEVLTVWILNLNYDFPLGSSNAKTLFCLRQAENLEKHFGYFFEFQAAEAAAELSKDYYMDLRHLKSLKLLIKAGTLAKKTHEKIITGNLIKKAAQ